MYNYILKRFLDFLFALVALVVLSPVILLVSILLYFANKGAGVFFKQSRPGKNEKIFTVIKFKIRYDERDGMLDFVCC
jgi:undecaprenyl phosphate N,N'-diacetylbacillosamine 1-phosphate transferase